MLPFKNIRYLILIILVVFAPASLHAQTDIKKLEPQEYFDFWVGSWELTWQDPDGSTGTGTNTIEKILDETVLLENFRAESGNLAGFKGKSFSVYDKSSGTWRQTWVDNNSDYLEFNGKITGNKRLFMTSNKDSEGNQILKRMVFYNITENSFTWDWESSSDNGKSWKLRWRINYTRK